MDLKIEDIISEIKANRQKLGITLYAPASLEEITAFENIKGLKLPDDIVTFYRFCNGFESDEHMFRIIPLDEIIENINDRHTSYISNPKDYHIAEYMIYIDMWSLHIDNNDKNNYRIYYKAETVLTNSFAEFLDTFLNEGVAGLYTWGEKIEAAKS
jgi:SMI1 / KNR4 family (SUKH-1)